MNEKFILCCRYSQRWARFWFSKSDHDFQNQNHDLILILKSLYIWVILILILDHFFNRWFWFWFKITFAIFFRTILILILNRFFNWWFWFSAFQNQNHSGIIVLVPMFLPSPGSQWKIIIGKNDVFSSPGTI